MKSSQLNRGVRAKYQHGSATDNDQSFPDLISTVCANYLVLIVSDPQKVISIR